MCRNVNFWNDVYALCCGFALEVNELLFGIVSIFGGELWEIVALQTEGSWCFCPVVAKVLLKSVVVEVHLERVHLIISHHLDELAQIVHRNVFASGINHKTT